MILGLPNVSASCGNLCFNASMSYVYCFEDKSLKDFVIPFVKMSIA